MIKIRFRRGTAIQWATTDIILDAGEPGYSTDTGVFKVGDGRNAWPQLQGYTTYADMYAAVEAAVEAAIIDNGGNVEAELAAHIIAEEPHPVYDDGSSFILRYLNAKV